MTGWPDLGIRQAGKDDLDAVAGTLAAAFFGGDLARWLVPDPVERTPVYPRYFRMFAEWLLTHPDAQVDATGGLEAVACWVRVGNELVMDIPDYAERLAEITGSNVGRFILLDIAQHTHHPVGVPHEYLMFLAVMPHRQGHGLGSALLRHRLTTLDTARTPVYLEATDRRNRALYVRHDFRSVTEASVLGVLPDGAGLFPMWRQHAGWSLSWRSRVNGTRRIPT